jgi:Tol biopolymer transport system component
MKLKMSRTAAILAFAGVAFLFLGLYPQESAKELLERAVYIEETKGDLEQAIEVYNKILAEFAENQPLAAKALYRIGLCHERLGSQEAQKAYRRLIDQYPGQKEEVALAKERLSSLLGPQVLKEANLRLVWAGPGVDFMGSVSPDGLHLSFVDWETGDLAIRDLVTGINRRLTNKGPWTQSAEFALYSKWSPDGGRIAYQWFNKDKVFELRVLDIKEPTPRVLHRNRKTEEEGEYVHLFDWSPDGKHVLAGFFIEGNEIQIGLISAEDGSLKILKSLFGTPSIEPGWGAVFSPDGKYIAYDLPLAGQRYLQRDIFLLSSDGSAEIPLIELSAGDTVIDWTPDGKGLLFMSDRTGTRDVWFIRISGGKPQGNPQLIKPGVGSILPMGITSGGKLFYGLRGNASDVYEVRIEPRTGKILNPPKMAVMFRPGYNYDSDYSSDGKLLAYTTNPRSMTNKSMSALGILSLETGQALELIPELQGFRAPRWAPDGRALSVQGTDQGGRKGIYLVDAQTSQVVPIVQFDKGMEIYSHRWAKDGKSLFYTMGARPGNTSSVFVHNFETGQEERLSGSPDDARALDISPDGKWLVLLNAGPNRVIRIMPASGGEPREIYSFEQEGDFLITPAWSADARYIYFYKKQPVPGDLRDLYRVSVDRGETQKIDVTMGRIRYLSVHPDGQRIAFSSRGANPERPEVWVMENFLPKKK